MPAHDTPSLLCRLLLVVAARPLFISVFALFALPTTYILCVLILNQIRAYRSPLRNLPGPKKAHWLKGNFTDVQEHDSLRLQEEWVKTYGHVIRYHSHFGVRPYLFYSFRGGTNDVSACRSQTLRVLAADPIAVAYVLQNSQIFQKSDFVKFILGDFVGRGTQ